MASSLLRVRKTSFNSNPNVGLYVYVTDSYCLVAPEVPDSEVDALKETFGVPVHRFSIAGTGLLGVFLAGTNKQLLVPGIILAREVATLEKLKIPYTIIETDFTALGNNILCNDKGCLISEEYPDADRKAIDQALGMKSKVCRVGEVTVIGSCAVATNTGCVLHRHAKDFEKDLVADTLQVPVMHGTVNLGNPFVRAGLAANTHGMLVGDLSGGPEIVYAEQALRGDID